MKKKTRTTPPIIPSIYNTTKENWVYGRGVTEAILEAISKKEKSFEHGEHTIRILDNVKNDREWIVRVSIASGERHESKLRQK